MDKFYESVLPKMSVTIEQKPVNDRPVWQRNILESLKMIVETGKCVQTLAVMWYETSKIEKLYQLYKSRCQ